MICDMVVTPVNLCLDFKTYIDLCIISHISKHVFT